MIRVTDPIDRFWPKVSIGHGPGACWTWTAGLFSAGYGAFFWSLGRGGSDYAHRFAYEALVGEIPEGLEIDHLCGNRACVNPGHMEAVTHGENCRRGNSPAMVTRRTGVCRRGHKLTPENITPNGGSPTCRECKRMRQRKSWRVR